MADTPQKLDQSGDYPGSLLSSQAMGGINAGKGFDFQARYGACRIPVWLLETAFHQLLFEGTGDIDVRYTEDGTSSRLHIQVKDHDVQPVELREVIEQFRQMDSDLPDTLRMRLLAESAMYMLPPASTATPKGELSPADVASPPSPE